MKKDGAERNPRFNKVGGEAVLEGVMMKAGKNSCTALRMPDGTVRDRYSNVVREFNGLNAVEGMNIEHSFANSWWGHTVNNAYCDLFNLFPSDGTANGDSDKDCN